MTEQHPERPGQDVDSLHGGASADAKAAARDVAGGHMQIGEVAARTGLSLRTIRYYEEVDLVPPSARSAGGFRLYSEADVERLELVKQMKPLDFPLEDMRDLLAAAKALQSDPAPEQRAEMLARLAQLEAAAEDRVTSLRRQLVVAEEFAASLVQRFGDQRAWRS